MRKLKALIKAHIIAAHMLNSLPKTLPIPATKITMHLVKVILINMTENHQPPLHVELVPKENQGIAALMRNKGTESLTVLLSSHLASHPKQPLWPILISCEA